MDSARLQDLLARLPSVRLVVFGDYFLDDYLILDRALSETSLETGLEAYQIVQTRRYPGAAGTVVSNLRALGVQVSALGLCGDDGEGYELRRLLAAQQVDLRGLLEAPGMATPTYHKPMLREAGGRERELNRMDAKFRAPLAADLEGRLMAEMCDRLAEAAGMIVLDQAVQPDCGAVTRRLQAEISRLGAAHPEKTILVDSREFLSGYGYGLLKANLAEALRATGQQPQAGESTTACADRCARRLQAQTGCPAVITLGSEGLYLVEGPKQPGLAIPAVPVRGPIDIVGAGDAVDAALGAALCAGATLAEAGYLASLVASVVIQQIGVTGAASPQQVFDLHQSLR